MPIPDSPLLSSLKLPIHSKFNHYIFSNFFLVGFGFLLLKGSIFLLLFHSNLKIWSGSGVGKKLKGVAHMAQNLTVFEGLFAGFVILLHKSGVFLFLSHSCLRSSMDLV